MPAELIEHGSLHRKNSPIGIVGRMGAGQNVEALLEIAVIGKRAAVAGEQRLVAGMSDGGLFEHGDGLAALPRGAQRLAIEQGRVGVLGIGAIAIAVNFHRTPRIGVGAGLGLWRQRSGDVGHGRLAAAEAHGQNRRHGRRCKKPGNTGLLAHRALTHGIRRMVGAECGQK